MKIRLLDIAHARSGDKGDTANVGVIARRPEYYPVLVRYLTAERVKNHFAGIALGRVDVCDCSTAPDPKSWLAHPLRTCDGTD